MHAAAARPSDSAAACTGCLRLMHHSLLAILEQLAADAPNSATWLSAAAAPDVGKRLRQL